jgi:cell fate (sporulation/competence/biofilm development) regulator YlbF (YheA/YmcA/DUF963 family)
MEDKYVSIIVNTEEFKRLKELKKIIDEKYAKEIVSFKRSEANYLEASEHKEFYPNFDEIVRKLSEAKSILYNKEEVKEYLLLERTIQEMLTNDFNELKQSISSKLGTNKSLKI